MSIVLGIDPGFSSIGFALVELTAGSEKLLQLGLIETEKSSKKQNVLASSDNFRRAKEISRLLRELPAPAAICAESMSFPRNSSAAAKVAMTWGILADFCYERKIPLVQASPKEVKLSACSNASASKLDVQAAMEKKFGVDFTNALQKTELPKSKHEHPVDALAVVVACLPSEVLTLIRQAGAP